ncbi:hypothetical protein PoB_001366300 [Plakobranchus ocellatus]|uniref:Uncharacterized protein n=1 Tax=Plakobranchus ocellatus TaxID=259542 RepID=A0AAV3YY41_9GAST|nr:hypothetical protein PoB_001366300 [Plakobranchus ocellatus]
MSPNLSPIRQFGITLIIDSEESGMDHPMTNNYAKPDRKKKPYSLKLQSTFNEHDEEGMPGWYLKIRGHTRILEARAVKKAFLVFKDIYVRKTDYLHFNYTEHGIGVAKFDISSTYKNKKQC